MEKIAVIVAGGSGLRMGNETPKQFLLLNGKPIIYHTINAFISAFADMKIVLVLPEAHIEKGNEILAEFNNSNIILVKGGDSRFQSVKNGLKSIHNSNSVVFVHDGVRCLITPDLIKDCYNQAIEIGSAIPAVAATDSIRISLENNQSMVTDRNKVRIVQTPQTFLASILLPAFEQPYQESFTDEASVVEAAGTNIFLIEGDYNNLKITRPIDLIIAERILEERINY